MEYSFILEDSSEELFSRVSYDELTFCPVPNAEVEFTKLDGTVVLYKVEKLRYRVVEGSVPAGSDSNGNPLPDILNKTTSMEVVLSVI